jgi:hypothetical protein
MRILGWVLLFGGLLLCASILWAAIGFLFMGLGLICLQIAEARNKQPAKLAASRSGKSDPRREPPPLQELSRALVPSDKEGHEDVDRESTIGQNSYDKERWRFLLSNDADISRVANALAPYRPKRRTPNRRKRRLHLSAVMRKSARERWTQSMPMI